jgi:hypothetical protein
MRSKHNERYDSRINQTALDLFRLGRKNLAEGMRHDSKEFVQISLGLHRALGLRPWQLEVLDFEVFDMTRPYPPIAAFELVEELHRRLAAVEPS